MGRAWSRLEDWPDAVPPIKRLLSEFERYFEENSAPDLGPAAEDLSALEEGLTFPGAGKDGPPPATTTASPCCTMPRCRKVTAATSLRYRLTSRGGAPESYIDIQVGAGLETGSAGGDDRLRIKNLKLNLLWSGRD